VIPDESDPILIGETSFSSFYADCGLDILYNIVNHGPELLKQIKIKGEMGNPFKIEDFLDILDKFKIKRL